MSVESIKAFTPCGISYRSGEFRAVGRREVCCSLVGENSFYPNVLLKVGEKIANPYDENILSLGESVGGSSFKDNKITKICSDPVFFFIYNTDNYFHFVYDTLPYLISYFKEKARTPSLKLLMNYPTHQSHNFYCFVEEYLSLLGIFAKDIIIADESTLYEKMVVSDSYTHGNNSSMPPSEEVYRFFNSIVTRAKILNPSFIPVKKIYISRRTWVDGNPDNIGTNYTNRRVMTNEDELVSKLTTKGYKEVFTEKLSTAEKVLLFNGATHIIGAIGGGFANCLFTNQNVKIISIISPTFLHKHTRFLHCFRDRDFCLYHSTEHAEKDEWKKYMRVRFKEGVGEVVDVLDDRLMVSVSDAKVAGWNSKLKLSNIEVHKKDCTKLDRGLNCAWRVDIDGVLELA